MLMYCFVSIGLLDFLIIIIVNFMGPMDFLIISLALFKLIFILRLGYSYGLQSVNLLVSELSVLPRA